MASISASGVKISAGPRAAQRIKNNLQAANAFSSQKLVSFVGQRKSFQSARLRISCAAKADTVEKVCEIVKKQLALSDDISINGQSKFTELGADSLDTVEIVMGLEEAFGISVEEEGAQSIATVQDAADLIENLVEAAK